MFLGSHFRSGVMRKQANSAAVVGLGLFAGAWLALAMATRPTAANDAAQKSGAASPVRYSRDIRPILSRNCFLCHGLDELRREAGLRLDQRELALAELDSGLRAIVPGKPNESELLARISSTDDDVRMPPGPAHEPLTPTQIALIRQWISEGANYEGHWSFTAPQRPAPPAPEPASWVRNPIDAFVLARLNAEGLAPSAEADRRTLIRRLTLDLTGLPPTMEETAAFLVDERPDAYEQLVDRLLASPRYGERMTLDWLDAARYADTHGYHIDSHRDMWPWRDWVIKAFNENMPFDQFTIWQLAGDLLPGATQEQRVASGFNRNHPINFEGGAIPEEYHVEYVIDRAATVGTVWLGLTLGCARCHDHKYDPISQKEFYQFFAFFNTVDEEGLDGTRGNAKPMMEVLTDEQRQRRDVLRKEVVAIEKELSALGPETDELQRQWEAKLAAPPQLAESGPVGVAVSDWQQLGPIEYDTPEQALAARLVETSPVDLTAPVKHHTGTASWAPAPQLIDGKKIDLSGTSSALYLVRTLTVSSPREVHLRVGSTDAVEVRLNGKTLWQQAGQRVFSPREQTLSLELREGANELLVKLVAYGREWQFQSSFDPGDGIGPPPHIQAIAKMAADKRSEAQAADLRTYFRANHLHDSQYQELTADLVRRDVELAQLNAAIPTTMVMREMENPRKSFRLDRGQYAAHAEEVSPGTPAALPPLPAGAPPDRIALARWLTSPAHPLTSRVTVNRLWQSLFGVGLVKTSEDFGLQGQWPSHPELLDWLAMEFIESRWDVKHMLRLMVTSSTYRQTAAATRDMYARDPDNQLLARGPRFRMPAEMVRDLALAVSGLLVDRLGGPSVNPYQPGDLWGELAHQKHNYTFTAQLFEQDHGDALYRRTMYTFWKRSVPSPNLAAFDTPSREVCTVRRERTNTPLQALVLLNDPTFVEAGRALAERLLKQHPDQPDAAARYGFELVTGREPSAEEIQILLAEYQRQLKGFTIDPAGAEALLAVGESQRDESLDPVQHAAWTNVAIVILNLDESITKD